MSWKYASSNFSLTLNNNEEKKANKRPILNNEKKYTQNKNEKRINY